MQVIQTKAELKKWVKEAKKSGQTIHLVPTMGSLHEGHFSLIRTAKEQGGQVVVSIFVNPIQFGQGEDYEQYPRSLAKDSEGVLRAGGDVIFAPSVQEMYPKPMKTSVSVVDLSQKLCGVTRPTHFTGVCTVVSKLFHLVEPDKAFFGQKDAQQVAVLQTMVEELNMPLEVEMVPTMREKDGLALSSRNIYLSVAERKAALVLSRSLQEAEKMIADGERSVAVLREKMMGILQAEKLTKVDYLSFCFYPDLEEVEQLLVGQTTLIALAVYVGKTRLIDNIIIRG